MAILCASVGDGLTRDGSFLNPAQDWTKCGWFKATTVDAGYNVFRTLGPSDYTPPWMWMGVDNAAQIYGSSDPGSGQVDTGATYALATAGVWVHVGLRYQASTNELTIVVNGIQAGSAAVVDLSGVSAQSFEGVAYDTSGDPDLNGGVSVGYVRDWQAWLTDAQLAAEMISTTAVLTTNLLADTPLTTVTTLTDTSGHGHGWTAVGTLATTTNAPVCQAVAPEGSLALSTAGTTARIFTPTGTLLGSRLLTVDVSGSGASTAECDVIPSSGVFVETNLTSAIYGSDGLLVDQPELTGTVGPGGVRVANGHFYIIEVTASMSSNSSTLYWYDADGTPLGSQLLPTPGGATAGLGVLAFAVSNDESTVYYSGNTDNSLPADAGIRTIYSYDLNAHSANPVVDTEPYNVDAIPAVSSLLMTENDRLIASWTFTSNAEPNLVIENREYDAAGTLVRTVTFVQPDHFGGTRLASSLTPSETYWMSWPGEDAIGQELNVSEINHTTGTIVRQFTTTAPLSFVPFFIVREGDSGGLPYTPSSTPAPSPGTTRAIRWERVFPLPFDMNLQVFLSRLEIFLQQGVGLSSGQGSDPVLFLSISKDGGQTFGNEIQMSVGKQGQYAFRTYANRLGRGRNLVAKIAGSDPVFIGLVAAFVDADEGTS